MQTRALSALVAAAGLAAAAQAQENIAYTLSWIEVVAGTSTPVPAPNGQLEPGEGARIRLSVNITPGIGATATYTPPPAPGAGTIAGLGSVFFDLAQTNAFGGTWTNFNRLPAFALGANGSPQADGGIHAAQCGQFVLPGNFANSTNPINNIWQATWNPSDYTIRPITFRVQGAVAGGNNHSSILIQYGTEPGTGDPLYVGRFVDATFGQVTINIPGPASLAVLGFAGLATIRRRR